MVFGFVNTNRSGARASSEPVRAMSTGAEGGRRARLAGPGGCLSVDWPPVHSGCQARSPRRPAGRFVFCTRLGLPPLLSLWTAAGLLPPQSIRRRHPSASSLFFVQCTPPLLFTTPPSVGSLLLRAAFVPILFLSCWLATQPSPLSSHLQVFCRSFIAVIVIFIVITVLKMKPGLQRYSTTPVASVEEGEHSGCPCGTNCEYLHNLGE